MSEDVTHAGVDAAESAAAPVTSAPRRVTIRMMGFSGFLGSSGGSATT